MIDNDHDNSTETVTKLTNEVNSSMSSTESVINTDKEQSTHSETTDQNDDYKENESQDDEFIRITAAHQMLTEAQKYDQQKNYSSALYLYRICVDLLLEELIFSEGTEQSRIYLREKCTALMDRIDLLKTTLDPVPLPTTTEQSTINPPSDQLESLNLS